jgi:hypothetical protein
VKAPASSPLELDVSTVGVNMVWRRDPSCSHV